MTRRNDPSVNNKVANQPSPIRVVGRLRVPRLLGSGGDGRRPETLIAPNEFADGEPVEVRADEDGVEERGRDRAGRSEGDAADQQCGHFHAPAVRRRPLSQQGMQELAQSLGIAAGEPLALPQERLPHLGDRGAGSLGDRLRVSVAVSTPVSRVRWSGTLSIDLGDSETFS